MHSTTLIAGASHAQTADTPHSERGPAEAVAPPRTPVPKTGDALEVLRRFESRKTHMAIAYFLLGLFGLWGAHRFYLGKTGSAVTMLCITLCSTLLMFVLLGFVTIWITLIWVIVDMFLVHGMVKQRNLRLIDELERSIAP